MTKPSITKLCLILAALIAPLALMACGDKKPAAQAQAVGEILPGSASDAMLPIDMATSQPPLAPKVEKSSGKSGDGDAADTEGAADPAEAPAAAPDPAPAKE